MINLSKRPFLAATALGASLALNACATSDSKESASGDNVLKDTSWVAEDIDGKGVLDNLQSTMAIALDNRVTGKGGCNNYFGLAAIHGETFTMGPVGATSMACPEAMMAQEQHFFAALDKARLFETRDGQLFLYDEAGDTVLRFSQVGGD